MFGYCLGHPADFDPGCSWVGVVAPPMLIVGPTCRWDWLPKKKTEGSVVFVEPFPVRAT